MAKSKGLSAVRDSALRSTAKKSTNQQVTKSQSHTTDSNADLKNGEAHRATYYISQSLHRDLKAYAVQRGESPSDIVAGLIEDFLKANPL